MSYDADMINTTCENLITVTKAAKLINPSRPPSVATLWRWLSRGVRGAKLESVLIGGIRYTSHEAVTRFLARLNGPGVVEAAPSAAGLAACAELERVGA